MILENLNSLKGFCWRARVKPTYVGPEQWNNLINELANDSELIERKFTNFNIRLRRVFNSFAVNDADNNCKEIQVMRIIKVHPDCTFDADCYRYLWLANKNYTSTDEIEDELTGLDAYQAFNEKFSEFLGNKSAKLISLLSGKKYKEQYFAIKQCVPTQISYICPQIIGKLQTNCYKADVSSAFPTAALGDLPTLVGCKTVNGKAEPTAEYPFAFYTKSGHIKTLDGLDSRKLNNVYFKYYKADDTVKAKDEVTILCKKMPDKYKSALNKAFEYFYNHRKEDAINKFVMNATIGFWQRNKNPILSFLSAIIILRCNLAMLDRCDQLNNEGNRVLFIATDSICWQGKYSNIAVEDKYLGSFTYEMHNGQFIGVYEKGYQIKTENGTVISKYSGLSKQITKTWKFGEILNKHTNKMQNKYFYNDNDHKFYFTQFTF